MRITTNVFWVACAIAIAAMAWRIFRPVQRPEVSRIQNAVMRQDTAAKAARRNTDSVSRVLAVARQKAVSRTTLVLTRLDTAKRLISDSSAKQEALRAELERTVAVVDSLIIDVEAERAATMRLQDAFERERAEMRLALQYRDSLINILTPAQCRWCITRKQAFVAGAIAAAVGLAILR